MVTRLEINAPGLARIATEAPKALSSRATLMVVCAVATHFPDVAEELSRLIATADLASARALANRLDEKYFDLDERRDEQSLRAFAQARAAMAVNFLLEGSYDEALYEAIMAMDEVEYVEAVFRKALRDEA